MRLFGGSKCPGVNSAGAQSIRSNDEVMTMSFVAVTVQRPSEREGAFLVCDGACDWSAFLSFAHKVLKVPTKEDLCDGGENDDGDLEIPAPACRALADRLERANEKEPHWAVMHNVDLPAWLAFLRACGGFKIFFFLDEGDVQSTAKILGCLRG
jgi:hypothetical protein